MTDTQSTQDRIIYICGAGGTGKTTLIESLLASSPSFMPADLRKLDRKTYNRKDSWNGYLENTFEYASSGLDSDAKRAKRISNLAMQNPDKIIFADRSVFDTLAYILAAERYGDISHTQTTKLFDYYKKLFENLPQPKNIVLLDYSLDYITQNLKKRVKTEGAAFRDDDLRYNECVVSSFKTVFSLLNCLTINNPLSAKEDILAWLYV